MGNPQKKYAKAQNTILPFLVAPIEGSQDQVLLGSDEMMNNHDSFINSLGLDFRVEMTEFSCARAFIVKQDYLNIYITFSSTETEVKSGRSGLFLTFGALLHRSVFEDFIPCQNFIRFYIMRFEKIFDVKIFEDGSSKFISRLRNPNNYDDIDHKLNELNDDLKSAFLLLRRQKPKKWFDPFSFVFGRYRKNYRFPKIVLSLKDIDKEENILNFFAVIDNYIQTTNRSNIDIFSIEGFESRSLLIIPCLPMAITQLLDKKKTTVKMDYKNSFIEFL